MKKNKMISTVIFAFALLTAAFAMSSGGNNEPAKDSQQVKQDVKNVQTEQPDQAKSNETVKDRTGVDTGMTEEELAKFKAQYLKRAEELGIDDNAFYSKEFFYENKVNLNSFEALKELGILSAKDSPAMEEKFIYNIIQADVIVVGNIENVEYIYKTQEEESGRDVYYRSRYHVKVESLQKGSEYYNSTPKEIAYPSPIGKYVWSTGDNQLEIGKKYVLFFRKYPNVHNDLFKIRATSLKKDGLDLYLESSKSKLILDYTQLLNKITKFQEINDTNNFYHRSYHSEVEK